MGNCARCGAVLAEGAAFCSECGERVEAKESLPFCAQCGAELPEGASFCSSCGAPRGGSATSRSPYAVHPTLETNVSDCLVWSIISTLIFFPWGVGALIFSLLSRNASANGDFAGAASYAEGARVWNIVLWVVVLGGVIIVGAIFILMAIFGLFIAA